MDKKIDLVTYIIQMYEAHKLANLNYNEGYLYTDFELEEWCYNVCHLDHHDADRHFNFASIKYKTLSVLLTLWACCYYDSLGIKNVAKIFATRYNKYKSLLFSDRMTKMTEYERYKASITIN